SAGKTACTAISIASALRVATPCGSASRPPPAIACTPHSQWRRANDRSYVGGSALPCGSRRRSGAQAGHPRLSHPGFTGGRAEPMTAPILADQPIRERLIAELHTTFFVEAGAGTGKTTALVSRIVELVARDNLPMERLAAITFTEAAAAELRDRVRAALEQAAVTRSSQAERDRCDRASREADLAS